MGSKIWKFLIFYFVLYKTASGRECQANFIRTLYEACAISRRALAASTFPNSNDFGNLDGNGNRVESSEVKVRDDLNHHHTSSLDAAYSGISRESEYNNLNNLKKELDDIYRTIEYKNKQDEIQNSPLSKTKEDSTRDKESNFKSEDDGNGGRYKHNVDDAAENSIKVRPIKRSADSNQPLNHAENTDEINGYPELIKRFGGFFGGSKSGGSFKRNMDVTDQKPYMEADDSNPINVKRSGGFFGGSKSGGSFKRNMDGPDQKPYMEAGDSNPINVKRSGGFFGSSSGGRYFKRVARNGISDNDENVPLLKRYGGSFAGRSGKSGGYFQRNIKGNSNAINRGSRAIMFKRNRELGDRSYAKRFGTGGGFGNHGGGYFKRDEELEKQAGGYFGQGKSGGMFKNEISLNERLQQDSFNGDGGFQGFPSNALNPFKTNDTPSFADFEEFYDYLKKTGQRELQYGLGSARDTDFDSAYEENNRAIIEYVKRGASAVNEMAEYCCNKQCDWRKVIEICRR